MSNKHFVSVEPGFKTASEFAAHLEGAEGNALHKDEVIEVLKGFSVRRSSGERRGQLAGLTLEAMSDEQLKREIINANSVLYKAKQRGASAETIEKNQARLDAAMAEKTKRQPEAPAAEVTAEATTEASDAVYNEDVANEL